MTHGGAGVVVQSDLLYLCLPYTLIAISQLSTYPLKEKYLDGFEGSEVAAEPGIMSRFLLMTPSLLFTSSGSFASAWHEHRVVRHFLPSNATLHETPEV